MAEEGQVVACHTVDVWKEQFEKGKGTQKLVFNHLINGFFWDLPLKLGFFPFLSFYFVGGFCVLNIHGLYFLRGIFDFSPI
jgi:hypothetical protein